eukprot:1228776-Alexandrium_andersonii.AAC.1
MCIRDRQRSPPTPGRFRSPGACASCSGCRPSPCSPSQDGQPPTALKQSSRTGHDGNSTVSIMACA